MPRLRWPGLREVRGLRGVRARLVAAYSLAALVVVALGGLLFLTQVERGLAASTDTDLSGRAAVLATSVGRSGDSGLSDLTAGAFLAAVYRPDGSVAVARPATAGTLVAPGDVRRRTIRTDREDDRQLRLLAEPVDRPDGRWVVVVGSDLHPADEATDRVEAEVLVALPVLLLVVAAGAWLLSGAALRPVERMRAEASELGAVGSDSGGRISDPGTGDELASLATTFNALLDRLGSSAARQRRLVADAGHELRTPLAVLRAELELADRPGRTREELADAVVHARDEVDRLSRLADDLLLLASVDEGLPLVDPVPVDLLELLAAVLRAHRATADAAGVTLELEADDPPPLRADPVALRRALDNLLGNALRATPSRGTICLRVRQVDGALELAVLDTGPGFPEEFLPHAFEQFRRADASRASVHGGAGLGLAITRELVTAHGGSATARNRPGGGGAEVALLLPL